MRASTLVGLLAILAIAGVYVIMQSAKPEETDIYKGNKIDECYQAALDCKETGDCSKCFSACSNIKNKEIEENARRYCKLGQADKILNLTD